MQHYTRFGVTGVSAGSFPVGKQPESQLYEGEDGALKKARSPNAFSGSAPSRKSSLRSSGAIIYTAHAKHIGGRSK